MLQVWIPDYLRLARMLTEGVISESFEIRVLGSIRRQLIGQFLFESLLINGQDQEVKTAYICANCHTEFKELG